jgi:hypothetical protein
MYRTGSVDGYKVRYITIPQEKWRIRNLVKDGDHGSSEVETILRAMLSPLVHIRQFKKAYPFSKHDLTLTFFLFLPTLVGTGGSYFFFSVLSPCITDFHED